MSEETTDTSEEHTNLREGTTDMSEEHINLREGTIDTSEGTTDPSEEHTNRSKGITDRRVRLTDVFLNTPKVKHNNAGYPQKTTRRCFISDDVKHKTT